MLSILIESISRCRTGIVPDNLSFHSEGRSQKNAKKGGSKDATHSEPSEINHHEPLLSSQGRKRVPKPKKSPKNARKSSKDKSKGKGNPPKSPKNLSNLIKGGAVRRVSRFSFPANASGAGTGTPSSIMNYAMGNVVGPVLGFEDSSDPDMAVLKGGSEMPRTKNAWKNLVRAELSATGRSLENPINRNPPEEKLVKKEKKKKTKKSLFRSKLSGVLNVLSRYGGHHHRKEPTKFAAGKESKTEIPGFEASRSNAQFRLSDKGVDRVEGWLNWDSRGDVGLTDDEKTYGWADVDFGEKKETRKEDPINTEPPPSVADVTDDSSVADVTSDRWEDWSSSSSCRSRYRSRRRR